jgi:hypothetical protein
VLRSVSVGGVPRAAISLASKQAPSSYLAQTLASNERVATTYQPVTVLSVGGGADNERATTTYRFGEDGDHVFAFGILMVTGLLGAPVAVATVAPAASLTVYVTIGPRVSLLALLVPAMFV